MFLSIKNLLLKFRFSIPLLNHFLLRNNAIAFFPKANLSFRQLSQVNCFGDFQKQGYVFNKLREPGIGFPLDRSQGGTESIYDGRGICGFYKKISRTCTESDPRLLLGKKYFADIWKIENSGSIFQESSIPELFDRRKKTIVCSDRRKIQLLP